MADDPGGDRRRLIRAFLLAPLVAPAAYAVVLLVISVGRSIVGHGGGSLSAIAGIVGLVAIIGTPIAYVSALAAGFPAYLVLRRVGLVSHLWIALVGAAIGVAAAIVIQPQVRGEMISFLFPMWVGGLLGLVSAEAFWRLHALS
jgi:hypothetical protein